MLREENDTEESMRATVYIATSVDGFIAREDGGIDWLPEGGGEEGGEDYGYQEFVDSVRLYLDAVF